MIAKLLYIFPALVLFVTPQIVFAGEPPQLTSPSDSSAVSSSKLEWQTPSYVVYSSDPYRIQVDNDSDFSSVYRDYKTNNNYYTPVLTEGKWYWKVKAKDSTGAWSDWSSIRSFTLATNSSPSPSPSLSPTPSSNPSPSPQPSPTSPSTTSFIISGTPSQINSDQSFSITVNLSLPNNPNTKFYLKGAFKKFDGSNYFGYTKVSGSFVKNGSTYSSQFPITTDPSGKWSGSLEVKADSSDSGFVGSGDYVFKVGRYSSSGSGPTWSNELSINISAVESSSEESQVGVGGVSKALAPSPSATVKKGNKSSSSLVDLSKADKIATIAGIENSPMPSGEAQVSENKNFNIISWIGIGLIFCGISSIGLLYLKNRGFYAKIFNKIR